MPKRSACRSGPCTDFGRLLFKRDPDSNWPIGWRAVALQVGAVVIGYLVGTVHRRPVLRLLDLRGVAPLAARVRQLPRALHRDQRLRSRTSSSRAAATSMRLRQIATAQRDASEAQLKLLESQLEPHMLFNTLANLRVLIGVDPARAQAMLDQLIAFLRATLSASREPLACARRPSSRASPTTSQLMQVRMGDAAADTARAAAPSSPRCRCRRCCCSRWSRTRSSTASSRTCDGGRIEVRADASTAACVLTVRDTGAGLDAATAAASRHALRPRAGARPAGDASTAPRPRSQLRPAPTPKAARSRPSPAGLRPMPAASIVAERHAARRRTMKPTALIAEDEPLLAAELQAELARLWPELRVVASVGHGARRGRAALRAAARRALPRHPHAGHRAGSKPRRRSPRTGPTTRRCAADRVRHRLRPVRAAGVRARGRRLPAEAGRARAPARRPARALQAALAAAARRQRDAARVEAALGQLRSLLASRAAGAPRRAPPRRSQVIQAGVGNAIHLVPVERRRVLRSRRQVRARRHRRARTPDPDLAARAAAAARSAALLADPPRHRGARRCDRAAPSATRRARSR